MNIPKYKNDENNNPHEANLLKLDITRFLFLGLNKTLTK
jgi:hypothetical protein